MTNNTPHRYPTIFQRLALGTPGHAIYFWLCLSACFIAISWITGDTLDNHQFTYQSITIYLALGLITVPIGVNIGYTILINWSKRANHFLVKSDPDIVLWFQKELSFIQGDKIMALCGMVLGCLSVLAFYAGQYFAVYPTAAQVYLAALMFISSSIAGIGLYAMFCVSRTFWRLGKREDFSLRVHSHRFGILSIGTALFKCWLIISFIWMIFTATAVVGYTGQNPDEIFKLPPMWLLAYPTLPLILGSFIICQIPLHQKMISYKEQEIQRIDKMLDEIKPNSVKSITSDLRDNVDFLERQRDQIRKLPDWPFSKVSLLGTGVSSVNALLPFLTADKYQDIIEHFRNITSVANL